MSAIKFLNKVLLDLDFEGNRSLFLQAVGDDLITLLIRASAFVYLEGRAKKKPTRELLKVMAMLRSVWLWGEKQGGFNQILEFYANSPDYLTKEELERIFYEGVLLEKIKEKLRKIGFSLRELDHTRFYIGNVYVRISGNKVDIFKPDGRKETMTLREFMNAFSSSALSA